MTLSLERLLSRESILSCFRPVVVDRPRWFAQYLGQGLCRFKWLSAAGILLWIVQALALTSGSAHYLYQPAADRLGVGVPTLIYGSVAIGIAGAVILLLSGRGGIGIERARGLVLLVAMTTVAAESLLFGFARLAAERVASLDLTLLLLIAIIPLGLGGGDRHFRGKHAHRRRFGMGCRPGVRSGTCGVHHASALVCSARDRCQSLVSRRIQGRTARATAAATPYAASRTTEAADRGAERRSPAAARRDCQATRRPVPALSSALTTPVAHAYVEKGHFPTELKTVCVIACDAVGFSDTCRKLQPERVVFELENFFREFDGACLKYHIEPLRAQGDSRIAIAGLWPGVNRHLQQEAISAVLAMLYFQAALPRTGNNAEESSRGRVLWQARMGICLGPASCGVIDTGSAENAGNPTGRLWFDVWGDTVNLAARIQEAAHPNQLLVRESVLWETCGLFDHGPIQQFQVKIDDACRRGGNHRDPCRIPRRAGNAERRVLGHFQRSIGAAGASQSPGDAGGSRAGNARGITSTQLATASRANHDEAAAGRPDRLRHRRARHVGRPATQRRGNHTASRTADPHHVDRHAHARSCAPGRARHHRRAVHRRPRPSSPVTRMSISCAS